MTPAGGGADQGKDSAPLKKPSTAVKGAGRPLKRFKRPAAACEGEQVVKPKEQDAPLPVQTRLPVQTEGGKTKPETSAGPIVLQSFNHPNGWVSQQVRTKTGKRTYWQYLHPTNGKKHYSIPSASKDGFVE